MSWLWHQVQLATGAADGRVAIWRQEAFDQPGAQHATCHFTHLVSQVLPYPFKNSPQVVDASQSHSNWSNCCYSILSCRIWFDLSSCWKWRSWYSVFYWERWRSWLSWYNWNFGCCSWWFGRFKLGTCCKSINLSCWSSSQIRLESATSFGVSCSTVCEDLAPWRDVVYERRVDSRAWTRRQRCSMAAKSGNSFQFGGNVFWGWLSPNMVAGYGRTSMEYPGILECEWWGLEISLVQSWLHAGSELWHEQLPTLQRRAGEWVERGL